MKGSKHRLLVFLFSLSLIISYFLITNGAALSANEKYISVKVPERVKIKVGEETTVEVVIKNICNQTLKIYVEPSYIEAPGHTICKVSPNYFILSPGEKKEH